MLCAPGGLPRRRVLSLLALGHQLFDLDRVERQISIQVGIRILVAYYLTPNTVVAKGSTARNPC